MKTRGTIRIPRSIKRWLPERTSTPNGNHRYVVTHPKDKRVRGIAAHQDPVVALHAAQRQAQYIYEQRKAFEQGINHTTSDGGTPEPWNTK